MGIYEFNALTQDEQAKKAWEDGVFLMHRVDGVMTYILFQVDGIYVEFHYQNFTNRITKLKTFTNPDLLDAYFAD